MADAAAAAPQLQEPDWLRDARDRAKEVGAKLELPTQKQKGWEFTDLSGFDLDAYGDADRGRGTRRLSAEGVVVMPLAAAAASEHADLLREHLGTIVPANDPFTARNEARWRDGLFVYVPNGERLSEPLKLTISGAPSDEISGAP